MKQIKIQTQPNDYTCGPTCLHAVYTHFGEKIDLSQIIHEIQGHENEGTLSVFLAIHALKKGYQATIYNYNLEIFDPSWFPVKKKSAIIEKLKLQQAYKSRKKLVNASNAYIEFLELGGKLRFKDLSPKLLDDLFQRGHPILTGLSATYLYQCQREYSLENGSSVYHDIQGEPSGHFVILTGYNHSRNYVLVADPFKENPVSGSNYYSANTRRVINSILLGILTYDANLLIIEPK